MTVIQFVRDGEAVIRMKLIIFEINIVESPLLHPPHMIRTVIPSAARNPIILIEVFFIINFPMYNNMHYLISFKIMLRCHSFTRFSSIINGKREVLQSKKYEIFLSTGSISKYLTEKISALPSV